MYAIVDISIYFYRHARGREEWESAALQNAKHVFSISKVLNVLLYKH
jgi:hypothetical protein